MPDREKAIQDLELVYEYIRKEAHDISASRKCRMLDKVGDAIALLKEGTELCDRCGRVRLKSKWEGR